MSRTKAIVIGSGFGGAVAALRLGQAGIETAVLERGRRWTITDPTRNATFAVFEKPDGRAEWLTTVTRTPGYDGVPIERYTGLLEAFTLAGIKFVAGAGVGGGSLCYAGILLQPPRELFAQIFPPSVSYDELDQVFFPRVRSVMEIAVIPDDVLNSTDYRHVRAFRDQALKAFPSDGSVSGFRDGVTKIEMGVDWNVVREEIAGTKVPSLIAAQFWWGNNSGAKRSLDRNYLKDAEATGHVDILPLHNVTGIAPAERGGYAVAVDVIDEQGEVVRRETLTCDHLFLAAGTFGTCKLLMRARARGLLPGLASGLGHGFGNDGDIFLARHKLSENTQPFRGGPGNIAIVNYSNPVMPSVMMPMCLPRFERDFPEHNAIASFVFSHTRNRGALRYDPATDSLDLDFDRDSDAAARSIVDRLNAANGGELHHTDAQITGHPLGGAAMGTVCDDAGRVNGYRNLYVVDGALIPGASAAVNPAFLIAGLAERCLDRILATDIRSGARASATSGRGA